MDGVLEGTWDLESVNPSSNPKALSPLLKGTLTTGEAEGVAGRALN
jgi:hypothetical protein